MSRTTNGAPKTHRLPGIVRLYVKEDVEAKSLANGDTFAKAEE
jgi:hypothetical protein